MRIAIPIHGDRISSVFDVARRFELLSVSQDNEVIRTEVPVENKDPIDKAKKIVELGAHVLICGAISWPLELMLVSAGVTVISNTCGLVEEVIAALIDGNLTEQAFLMPGCQDKGDAIGIGPSTARSSRTLEQIKLKK